MLTKLLGMAAMLSQISMNRANVATHNACNMSTTAFKGSQTRVEDLGYEELETSLNKSVEDEEGLVNLMPGSVKIGMGANVCDVVRSNAQGKVVQTGNKFDLSIVGTGYFQVECEDGSYAYTRDGSFRIVGGELVDKKGNKITCSIGSDNIDPNTIRFDIKKSAFVDKVSGNEVLKTALFRFHNEEKLEAIGSNMMKETTGLSGSGNPIEIADDAIMNGEVKIRNEQLEGSNVDLYQTLQEVQEAKENQRLAMLITRCIQDMNSSIIV